MPDERTNSDALRRWRGDGPTPAARRRAGSRKTGKIFLLAAGLLALAGAVIALILMPRPLTEPDFLTLPVREYANLQWPVNALAFQDGDALLHFFKEDRRKNAFESQTGHRILKELSDLPAHADRPLVVHLCAHAVCQGDEVFILPADAVPANSNTWLRLREFLEPLQAHPARQKLLILDLARPMTDPRLGLLQDDVAGKVQAYLEKEQAPLSVLCSCSRGQVSLVLEDARLSVFAFYLHRGLSGHADGFGAEGRQDGRITVQELADYVRHHVDIWARRNRLTRQTPWLRPGTGGDFVVAHRQAEPPDLPATDDLKEYPGWLLDGWKLRDQWAQDGSARLAPRPFTKLETLLMRAEERWLGGIELSRLQKELGQDSSVLREQVKYARGRSDPVPRSLALALTIQPPEAKDKATGKKAPGDKKGAAPKGGKPPADPAELVRDLLGKLEGAEPKKEDLIKAKTEFLAKVKDMPEAPLAQALFLGLAGAPNPTLSRTQLVADILQDREPRPLFAEAVLLRRLSQFTDRITMRYLDKVLDKEWAWPEAHVSQALRTNRTAEQTVAALYQAPYARPWVEGQFQKADGLRREGEKLLFTKPPSNWGRAVDQLTTAEEEYTASLRQIQHVRQAFETYATALALLPGYVPYLIRQQPLDPEEFRAWSGAVRETTELARLLQSPVPGRTEPIEERQVALQDRLTQLRLAFRSRLTRLRETKDDTAATYRQLQGFLASPLLAAGERAALWSRAHQLGQKLHDETVTEERQHPTSEGKKVPAVSQDEVNALALDRAYRRAFFSIQLLKLAGLPVDDLPEVLSETGQKADKVDLSSLAPRLRELWTEKLPLRFQNSEKDLFQAERLSWFLPLSVQQPAGAEDLAHWSRNPTAALNRQRSRDFWRWLAERYQAEQGALTADSVEANFFRDAAAAALQEDG